MSTEDLCREVLQNEENDAILFLHNELKKAKSKKSLLIHLPSTWSKSKCQEFGNSLKEIGLTSSKSSFLSVKTDYIIDYDLITPLKKVVKELIKENKIISSKKENNNITKRNNIQNNKSLSLSLSLQNDSIMLYNDDNYIKETMPPPSNKSTSIKRKSNNNSYDNDKVIKKSNSMSFYDILSIFINKEIIIEDNRIISDIEEIRNCLNKKTTNELKEFIITNCKSNENNTKGRKQTLIDNIINYLLDSLSINNKYRSSSNTIILNDDMKENIPESNIIMNNDGNNSEINKVINRPSISLSLSSSFDKKLENENEISTDDSSDESMLKSLNNSINNYTLNDEKMEIEEEEDDDNKPNEDISIPSSNRVSNIINNVIENGNENTELIRKDINPRPSYMNYRPNLNEEDEVNLEINNINDINDKLEDDRTSFSSDENYNDYNRNSNSLSTVSYSPENDKDLSIIRSSTHSNNGIRNNSLINSKCKIFERKRMSIMSLSPKFSLPNKSFEAVKTLSRISMFISKESINHKNSVIQNNSVDNNLSIVLSESDRSSLLSTPSIDKSEIIKETPLEIEKEEEVKEEVKEEEEEEEVEKEDSAVLNKEESTITKESDNHSITFSPDILTNIFNYLPFNDLIKNTLYVSKQWNRISQKTLSWISGTNIINNNNNNKNEYVLSNYKELWNIYPWGRYLSNGGFKEVYKIYNKIHNRYEALSIMNINEILELNNEVVMEQEILCGFAVSEIVSMKESEHFVEIYQVFEFKYNAPNELWGCDENKTPQGENYEDYINGNNNNNNNKSKNNKNNKRKKINLNKIKREEGIYQYTRMEYCDVGDLEEYIKTLPDERMNLEETIITMFQMTVSLYKAKKICNLRHNDVKLLNFFGKSYKSEEKTGVHWIYNKDEKNHFEWKKNDINIIIKLADYGTSEIGEESLNNPITIGNYTTIENLPIEYFVKGNECVNDNSCDIWELGLSFFHLLTGKSPYEEILESVKCPQLLIKRLRSIINKNHNYSILKEVMKTDEEEICLTTLYRILVLFGLPKEDNENAMISEILKVLKNNKSIKEEYEKDRKEYSLEFGCNYFINRCRERIKEIENGYEILMRMFEYDSVKRIKIEELIESEIFISLKVELEKDEKYEIKCYNL